MVQISSFYILATSKEEAKGILKTIKSVVSKKSSWKDLLHIENEKVTIGEDVSMAYEDYERSVDDICQSVITKELSQQFICKAEFYNDDLEIHQSIMYQNGYYQHVYKKEEYANDLNETTYYFGKYVGGELETEAYDEYSYELDEVMCPECGEYIKKHMDFPISYCPFCDFVEKHEEIEEVLENFKWKEFRFEEPLEISLPEKVVSLGQDWLDDCEEDTVFGLNPAYYLSKNQYNAALRLCRICAGWYHFDDDKEKELGKECCRAIIEAKPQEPMWYFDLWSNSFDWMSAIHENNPRYMGKLLEVDHVWTLFNTLSQRSFIEKAECFEWMVDFFGDALKYETRYRLADSYVQNYYDPQLENILYFKPNQIEILTKSVAKISNSSAPSLARAAAGLIRLGKRQEGLALYKKSFAMVWGDKTSVDDKKNVVDFFIERLGMGYENEEYIDQEIATLLEKQIQKYSDGGWTSKIRLNLGRNKK